MVLAEPEALAAPVSSDLPAVPELLDLLPALYPCYSSVGLVTGAQLLEQSPAVVEPEAAVANSKPS